MWNFLHFKFTITYVAFTRAAWLPCIISWFIDVHLDDDMEDTEVEEKSSVGQLQGLYAAALDGVQSSHQVYIQSSISRNVELTYFTSVGALCYYPKLWKSPTTKKK